MAAILSHKKFCAYPLAISHSVWDTIGVMSEQVNSTSEAIDRLGGNSVVAKALGVTPNAVGNWRVVGFPARRFPALSELLKAKGLSVPFSLFGMVELKS